MQCPHSFLSITPLILLLGSFVHLIGASVADSVGLASVGTTGTWPEIPFTVPINGTTSKWIHFSYGGPLGTLQQTSAFVTLGKNLSMTFAKSNLTIRVPSSNVGDTVENVYILFQLTPQTLQMKTYSTVIDMITTDVKKWGVKEMDFEVGSGSDTSTPEGIFQVRLSPNPLAGDASDNAGAPLPSFFDMVIPPSRPSSTTSATHRSTMITAELDASVTGTIANGSVVRSNAPGSSHNMSTSLISIYLGLSRAATSKPVTTGPASRIFSQSSLHNSSVSTPMAVSRASGSASGTIANASMPQPKATFSKTFLSTYTGASKAAASTPSTLGASLVPSNARLFNTSTTPRLISPTGTLGNILSTNAPSLSISLAQVADALSSTIANGSLSTTPGGMASITSAPAAALSGDGGSGTRNAVSTTGSVAVGGLMPHRDGDAGLAAGAAAGALAAAGGIAQAAGNGDAAAPAAAAGGAADTIGDTNGEGDNDDEGDDNEKENQSLSLGDPSRLTSSLGIQSTPQSQSLFQTITQTASTTAAPQPSRSLAPSSFFTTAAPAQNSSIPTSSMAITSCLACTDCPGFQVNVLFPSNGTSEDEDYDGADDGDPDADTNLPKRAAGRRYRHQKRETPIMRKFVGSDGLQCTVTPYTRKPAYPGPGLVVKYEDPANESPDMGQFYQVAKYWAVPSDVPQGSCEAPSWKLRDTVDITNKDPAVNPNPWIIGGESPYSVNIDHVYETQLVNMFFYARLTQDPNAPYAISCENITKVFDEVDDRLHPELGTRINTLYSKLASYQNPEFLGMGQSLNTRKGRIFAYKYKNDAPMLFPKRGFNVEMIRTQFAQLALTLDMMNNATIWALFETTNSRIYQELQRVDQLVQYRADNNCADKFLDANGKPYLATWAESYKSWMTDRIMAYNIGLQRAAARAVNAIPTDGSGRWKVPPISVPFIAAVWAPWLTSFTSAWPVDQMTLPSVSQWPIASPANFGPGDCLAVQTMSPSLAPTANSNGGLGSSTVPIITSPVTTPGVPPSTIFSVASAPVSPISTLSASSPAATSAAPASGDPCGPLIQDNPNYPDTCDAKPAIGQSPAAYGVLCSSQDPSNYQGTGYIHGETQMNWASCMVSAKQICADVNNAANPTGYWIWSYQQKGCAVGIYLPGLPGSAPPPTPERCETLIFQGMVDGCSATATGSSMASVNLVNNPSYLATNIAQGSQVNAGYPSYVISPTVPGWLGRPAAPWPKADSAESLAGAEAAGVHWGE